MITTIVSGSVKALIGALPPSVSPPCCWGDGGLALRQPPELASISDSRNWIDFATLPKPVRWQARDGTELAYRHYPAHTPAADRIAIVVHGSSGSSRSAIHTLSMALAARGVESFAVDIRGHGSSGTRGDIRYAGQLEDDLADLVAEIRKTRPTAHLTLINHSSGGGFALQVAGSPIRTCSRAPCCWHPISATTPSTRIKKLGQA
jgi:acetyl esterase/lipase